MRYCIMLLLPDLINWWEVCSTSTPEGAAEIVRILLSQGNGSPGQIKIEVKQT